MVRHEKTRNLATQGRGNYFPDCGKLIPNLLKDWRMCRPNWLSSEIYTLMWFNHLIFNNNKLFSIFNIFKVFFQTNLMVFSKIWIICYNLKCRESHNFVENFLPQKWDRGRKVTFLMSGRVTTPPALAQGAVGALHMLNAAELYQGRGCGPGWDKWGQTRV